MKRTGFLFLIIGLIAINSITSEYQVDAQRTIEPNILDVHDERFVMGNDSGHLSVYNEQGELITQKKVAQQIIGHLQIGIKGLIWINSSTIAYQTGPTHLGIWNILNDIIFEFPKVEEGIHSINYEESTNSLIYIRSEEKIIWQSLSNYNDMVVVPASVYVLTEEYLDVSEGKVSNLIVIDNSILLQYNSYLYHYNQTSTSVIGKYDDRLSETVIIEVDQANEIIFIAQSGIVRSLDYNLNELYRWYFVDQTVTSIAPWGYKLIVGFGNGDIRIMSQGNSHGEKAETNVNRIEDLVVIRDKIVFVSETGGPFIISIDFFMTEKIALVTLINEFFWKKNINRKLGWSFIIGIIIFSVFLILIFVKKNTTFTLMSLKRVKSNQEDLRFKRKGFGSMEEYIRIKELGFQSKTAYNQANTAANKEGWKSIEDKKSGQLIGVTDPNQYY